MLQIKLTLFLEGHLTLIANLLQVDVLLRFQDNLYGFYTELICFYLNRRVARSAANSPNFDILVF